MFGTFFPGSSPPSSINNILTKERNQCSFNSSILTNYLDGSEEQTKRRRWIWKQGEIFKNDNNYNLSRSELVSQHIKRFIDLHKTFLDNNFIPSSYDVMLMSVVTKNSGALSLHYGAFIPTILSQGTQEQHLEWLFPAFQMKIIGCLAQTELGHGSNVRGLQTIAKYIKETDEFELNSPTLESIKWWPGGLGKTATHAIVYAQLLLNDDDDDDINNNTNYKSMGIHSFIIQIRDENHKPLNGIELGEIGPKIGDNSTESGFMRLSNIRIPREWMLMKNQKVTNTGKYIKYSKDKSSDKIQYTTMLTIRTALVIGAGYKLAQGVCIASRYSCIRHQGFIDENEKKELQIIDYQVQSYRILKQLSIAYAFVFTGKNILKKFESIKEQIDKSPLEADLR